MEPSPSSSGTSSMKYTFACVSCSERKVKCNRQSPCSACIRHKVPCTFRAPKPPRRRRKLNRAELKDERLKRYEVLLQEKGIDPNQSTDNSQAQSRLESSRSRVPQYVWQLPTTSTDSTPQETVFEPFLLQGERGAKLVDNSLWLRVLEEIQDPEEALDGEEPDDHQSGGIASRDDFTYILDWNSPAIRPLHPSAHHIHRLWRIFTENVNPLVNLVHVPSLSLAIEKAAANIESIPAGFEALMFSIYSLAVLSLKEDECKDLLRESRAVMLPSFVAATKAALSRAKFMSTNSIVVLQALVHHIISIRDASDPRGIWSLSGVAIRIAEGMGTRIDGILLGLSPFEIEIRRRVWWQLVTLDSRAAELAGQSKFRGLEFNETTPKKPANVNGSDLYPAMRQAPPESTGPTEMMWSVLKADLTTFAHTHVVKRRKENKAELTSEQYPALDDLHLKDEFSKEMEDMVETKYLRFCDPSQPLHFLTLLAARYSLNLVRFTAHHPRRWANMDHVPASEQDLVWNTVVKLLELYNMLQSSPQLQGFSWNASYFIQWHAIIYILDTLRANPLRLDADKAWRLIDALYHNNSEKLLSIKRPIVTAVGNLCLRAFDARAGALAQQGRGLSDPPEYIPQLRELREVAKARVGVTSSKSKGQEDLGGEGRLLRPDIELCRPGTNQRPAGTLIEAPRPQYPVAMKLPNPAPGSTLSADDAFWLGGALDDGTVTGGATDAMNQDMTAMLAEDYWLENPNEDGIDWARWDSWSGNLGLAYSNIGTGSG